MKVLNLYAGIGGNRRLWENVDVTAVEINQKIADIYMDYFPNDEVVVGDAHKFLKNNYDEGWDFIWSSPPCPTHSQIRNNIGVGRGQNEPVYPDMKLYQEIIFIKRMKRVDRINFDGKYCVENVIPDYEPLIEAQEIGNHLFWSNFHIPKVDFESTNHNGKIEELYERKGFDLSNYNNLELSKKKILRNCVPSELGKHILQSAKGEKSDEVDQNELF